MRILMISSEVAPFAKTGGLADVVGALPKELARRGHDVRVFMPYYKNINTTSCGRVVTLLHDISVQWGSESYAGNVLRCLMPGTENIALYFIQQPFFFHREGIYGENNRDYPDNDLRYGFFCYAVLWALRALDWKPDIIHLHDWQTGLVAPILRFHPYISSEPFYSDIRTVMTIHNLAYQGIFSADLIPKASLPWTVFSAKGMEFHSQVSLLKAGIVYSDRITTVSPTYALEIQTPEFGAGLDGTLRDHAGQLDGIMNGIDTAAWNPLTDKYLPAHYSVDGLAGKRECRRELIKRFGIKADEGDAILGIVSRLVDQKGLDLVQAVAHELLKLPVRLVVLGTGSLVYEDLIRTLAKDNPGRVGAKITYDEQLAHLVEAGADMFLMPSRFEPSGLNQLYSMRYGTIPIVRHVGGLADSVTNTTVETLQDGSATGFSFIDYKPEQLLREIERALKIFRDEPETWNRIMRNAMKRDSSWTRSAVEYERVYNLARQR